jgi:DNA polymerase-3 subunit gamma/tau
MVGRDLGLAPDEYAALTMVLLRLLAFNLADLAEKKTLKQTVEAAAGAPAVVVKAAAQTDPSARPSHPSACCGSCRSATPACGAWSCAHALVASGELDA